MTSVLQAGHPAACATHGYGTDIASKRSDELDALCVDFATQVLGEQTSKLLALDLGCGAFGQSLRLADIGVTVTAVDLNSGLVQTYERLRQSQRVNGLTFLSVDAKQFDFASVRKRFDLVYSQRMLHYLRYGEAVRLLRSLVACSSGSSQYFLSVSGISSELGLNYEHASTRIEERFGRLAAFSAKQHDIQEPVCLYSMDEFSRLLSASGLRALKQWSSPFGNLKAVCDVVK